jgi:uncharacterized protein (TIGR02646 family)
MKHITKSLSPPQFEAWKASGDSYWQPTYGNLQSPQKPALQMALLAEQGWVCCYCGGRIDEQTSHIEHFRPQSQREDLSLSYENLHASCLRETEASTPLHCGHAKDSAFDESRHISPLDPRCESRFSYTFDGQILASEASDPQANYMIDLLKLDLVPLRNRRQEAVSRVFDVVFLAQVTDAELQILIASFVKRDENGKHQNLGHVLACFAESLLRPRRPNKTSTSSSAPGTLPASV